MAKKKAKPKPSVKATERFIAAPENVLKDEAERGKLLKRKAREEARRQRIAAGKRKTPPTIEDMLADVIRVAEDPDTNPIGHGFRSISRARYEEFGHYPVQFLDRQWGTWAGVKQAAGLEDEVGTRLWRNNRAKEARREHAERMFERTVQPYVARQEDYRKLTKPYLLLTISDTHAQWLCPFVFSSFLQAIRDLKPNGVLVNGDWLEGSEISRHPKIPGWTVPLQDELDFCRSMFGLIREAMGEEGDLWLVNGNHDPTTRLVSYLSSNAPALTGLRCLRVDQLLGLGDFDVKLMMGGSPLSPPGQANAKPGFLLYGLRVHHGYRTGKRSGKQEVQDAGRSTITGHIHHGSVAYYSDEVETRCAMTLPAGARDELGHYVQKVSTGWQRGFGGTWLWPDKSVHHHAYIAQGTPERLVVEGHIYERAKACKDPEPKGNWLEGWSL